MKFYRFISGALIIFCCAFTFFYGRYKIAQGGLDTSPKNYKGIITIWQIDSFEGGVGSRKQFLLKVARDFEKQHTGVLVMVVNQTIYGVLSAYENGDLPDIISFGTGTEVRGNCQLNIDKTILGGMVGDKCYATAWCRGGYVLIINPNLTLKEEKNNKRIEKLLVSQGEYTQPLTAFLLEGYTANEIEILEPMDAYIKFTSGKVSHFLATQRDVSRLLNRGMIFDAIALENYNDLYQYISVTSEDCDKRFYSQKFVEFLISDKVQKSLTSIGMYSPFITTSYDTIYHQQLQNTKVKLTVSAFTSGEILKEMQRLSSLAVKGDEKALNNIKNMCVMP